MLDTRLTWFETHVPSMGLHALREATAALASLGREPMTQEQEDRWRRIHDRVVSAKRKLGAEVKG